eukprot:1522999-Lingulodinium_polyedra.AAC.1
MANRPAQGNNPLLLCCNTDNQMTASPIGPRCSPRLQLSGAIAPRCRSNRSNNRCRSLRPSSVIRISTT